MTPIAPIGEKVSRLEPATQAIQTSFGIIDLQHVLGRVIGNKKEYDRALMTHIAKMSNVICGII